jgi:gliding motility-associated-like protein
MNAGPDIILCGESSAMIGIPDASGLYIYSWTPAAPLDNPSSPNPTATVLASTTFNVLRLPTNFTPGCPARDTVTINLFDNPEALFSYDLYANCRGVSAIITNNSINYTTVLWKFSNGESSTEISPNQTFVFNDSLVATLIVSNGECRDTLSIAEYLKDFNDYFKENNSNAFSPNGDGVNDCFNPALQLSPAPYDRAFLECTDLWVYNRWGELVHSSENDNEACWYGTSMQGEDLPEGVYFYRFSTQGKEHAGTVHLRRTDL